PLDRSEAGGDRPPDAALRGGPPAARARAGSHPSLPAAEAIRDGRCRAGLPRVHRGAAAGRRSMSVAERIGWDRLRHGGLLLDPQRLSVLEEHLPPELSWHTDRELRRRI